MSRVFASIGFMQGRLSPLIDGKIQAFPWAHWQEEFAIANSINLHMMEWTLDQDRLYENPLMTSAGQSEIMRLCDQFNMSIPSLTGDCFMQAPFWKAHGAIRASLELDFLAVVRACSAIGTSFIVLPLVENGRLDTTTQENALVEYLQFHSDFFSAHNVKILFESDFSPGDLARFIDRLDPAIFGINYDIGNSAALGMNPSEEFAAYGLRIVNVHIKDRMLGGTTVALGTGNADFPTVFSLLHRQGYRGNYIMQTARATDDAHASVLQGYMEQIVSWTLEAG